MDIDQIIKSNYFKSKVNFLNKIVFDKDYNSQKLQFKKLKFILKIASTKIPFYKDYFYKNHLDLNDFKTVNDLCYLPIINKSFINDNYKNFLRVDVQYESLFSRTTGGSTGEPLKVIYDYNFKLRDLANTFFYTGIAGHIPRSEASLRVYGDVIDLYEYDYNILKISIYDLSFTKVQLINKEIVKHRPKYIHGRPSAVIHLIETFLKLDIKFPLSIKTVFLDGEVLSFSQKQAVEKFFNCKVFVTYGHTEGSLLGYSCINSDNIHFHPNVGIVELIENKEENQTNNLKKVITTGLNNLVFPLIRYDTNDLAVKYDSFCECSQNSLQIKEIIGRVQDLVYSKNGSKLCLTPFFFNYNLIDWRGVERFQYIQEKKGLIKLKLVPNKNYKNFETYFLKLKETILTNFPEGFEINFEIVDKINRTKRGKYKYFIQKIDE